MQGTSAEETLTFCDKQKEACHRDHSDCAQARKALRWPADVPFVMVASMRIGQMEAFLRHYHDDFPEVVIPTCVTA
jgi:hypothetical protein